MKAMKAIKAVMLTLGIHLYIQIDILLQIKSYDSRWGDSDILALVLPIIFAVAVFFIIKTLTKKEFWISVISFVGIYVLFSFIGITTDYFKWLFNLMQLDVYYDDSYYELGINAMLDGVLHMIAVTVSYIIGFIKIRRTQ